MRRILINSLSIVMAVCLVAPARAKEPEPAPKLIREAIARSLALIEKSTEEYRRQRQCFSCHHQALPVLALAEARRRGFVIDEENFEEQLRHTFEHLKRGRSNYREGRGQGGRADTAGYALWTLEEGGWKPDETTSAVTHFLLQWQKDRDHWRHTSNRPPSEASDFTTTYLAIRGLRAFGTADQQPDIEARVRNARKWLAEAKPEDTEDRVFRLRALSYLNAGKDAITSAAAELIAAQRDDGGWAQKPDMKSDAYATGTALVALQQAGALRADDPAYRRGVQFLLKAQRDDGSWHVESRSKPFQTYFESGFPHGKDQFIAITASSWATLALLRALPEKEPAPSSADKDGRSGRK